MTGSGGRGRPSAQQEADQAALAVAKATLRAAVLLRRRSRTPQQRAVDDGARLAVLDAALSARLPATVAAHLSVGSEPETVRLVAWLAARDVAVLLPVLTDGRGTRLAEPAWAPYAGPDALRVAFGGLLEPSTGLLPASSLIEAEVVICPGLAASRSGDRLGRGGGWYDRALAHASPSARAWVLLNRDEVLPTIPAQPWDRRVGDLVTPDGMIRCRPGSAEVGRVR